MTDPLSECEKTLTRLSCIKKVINNRCRSRVLLESCTVGGIKAAEEFNTDLILIWVKEITAARKGKFGINSQS